MKKITVFGIAGGIIYAAGLIWQTFELIRNLISDTAEVPWQVYLLAALLIAVFAAFLVIYTNYFISVKKAEPSKRRLIVITAAGGAELVLSGIITAVTAVELLRYVSESLLNTWLAILISPSFLMFLGALFILIMSAVIIVSRKKAE